MENRHIDALRRFAQAEAMWQADGHEPRSFLLIHRGGMKREIDHPRWDPSWSAPGEATIDDLQELGLLRVEPIDPSKNKARTFWVTMRGRETAAAGADSVDRSPIDRSKSPVAESPDKQSSVGPPPKTAFVTWAHGDDEWEQAIAKFTFELRKLGVEADVDLFHMADREVNWATYGPNAVRNNEFVLIAASPAYKERWEGTGNPREGAGAAREANVLKTMFNHDQDEFCRRVKVVLLPGTTTKDIPDELGASAQHFLIKTIAPANLENLLRTLTAQPVYVPPDVGRVPTLPTRFVAGPGVSADPGPTTLEQVQTRLDDLERAVHAAPGDERLAAERNTVEVALDALRSGPEGLSLEDSVWVSYELDLVHATVTSLDVGFVHQIEVQLDGGDKIVVDRGQIQIYPPFDD